MGNVILKDKIIFTGRFKKSIRINEIELSCTCLKEEADELKKALICGTLRFGFRDKTVNLSDVPYIEIIYKEHEKKLKTKKRIR